MSQLELKIIFWKRNYGKLFLILSDYYYSKLIPNFFVQVNYKSNYTPTIIAARVTLSTAFFAYLLYRTLNKFADRKEKTKKYSNNIYSKYYINNEIKALKDEKTKGNKILF